MAGGGGGGGGRGRGVWVVRRVGWGMTVAASGVGMEACWGIDCGVPGTGHGILGVGYRVEYSVATTGNAGRAAVT